MNCICSFVLRYHCKGVLQKRLDSSHRFSEVQFSSGVEWRIKVPPGEVDDAVGCAGYGVGKYAADDVENVFAEAAGLLVIVDCHKHGVDQNEWQERLVYHACHKVEQAAYHNA